MAKNKDEPKTFSFSWGKGVVEEEAQIVTEWHKPTVQLLRYEEGDARGSYSVRFCHYDHHGRFKRSPLMILESDLENLRRALQATPKLRRLLSQLSEPIQEVVESDESFVIHCRAPETFWRGARCGCLNTGKPPPAAACVIRAI